MRSSECILVVAPIGRDSEIARNLLRESGYESEVCNSLSELAREISKGAGMAIISDEALVTSDIRPLCEVLEDQEAWSDFPIVVLTSRGGGPERNPAAARLWKLLGNVAFLERPFHPTTFVSLAQTGIRARRRQYEARSLLTSLRESEARLEERVQQELGERRRAEEALRQAQKMEALGQLTGGVAHDFNNLLMAIMGNMDLLRKHFAGDARARRLIDGAIQGATRGAALTQRMLAFARQQELRTRSTDISALIVGMEQLLKRSLGPQIVLKLALGDKLPQVEVDATQVELAILNLAINARDAMPNGGEIAIRTDYPEEHPVTLTPGSYVRVTVRDSGGGMSEDTLVRATEPFFSTKPLGKGTGLGLSMVHGLAVQMGGLFELDSTLGVGTTASIWLPASQAVEDAHVPKSPASAQAPVAEADPATILLVDDDALIGMATADMLEDLGHNVLEARSGRAALDILNEKVAQGQKIDLVITDHAMPGMTGVELAGHIRDKLPTMPVLLATGYADLPSGQRSDLPRLTKPYDQIALRRAIDQLLALRGP